MSMSAHTHRVFIFAFINISSLEILSITRGVTSGGIRETDQTLIY